MNLCTITPLLTSHCCILLCMNSGIMANLLSVCRVPSYSQGLQMLLSSIMVSNPQERPNINWVLDQVQDLQSRSPNTQTNMVWSCTVHWMWETQKWSSLILSLKIFLLFIDFSVKSLGTDCHPAWGAWQQYQLLVWMIWSSLRMTVDFCKHNVNIDSAICWFCDGQMFLLIMKWLYLKS